MAGCEKVDENLLHVLRGCLPRDGVCNVSASNKQKKALEMAWCKTPLTLTVHWKKWSVWMLYLRNTDKVLLSRVSRISTVLVTRQFSQSLKTYRIFNSPISKTLIWPNYQQVTIIPTLQKFTRIKACSYITPIYPKKHYLAAVTSSRRHYSKMENSEAMKEDAIEIFHSAINSVLPRQLIDQTLKYDPHSKELQVHGNRFRLNQNVYVVGFGKAVLGMARAVEDLLGDHMVQGILSVPVGIQQCFKDAGKCDLLLSEHTKFIVYEGAKNNLPDQASERAAHAIHQLVSRLQEGNILIVLISGGGSALLPSPHPPITLEEEMTFTRLLAASGATIQELNTVRKNIELLKGGGLAMAAMPAKVLSLILSDVIGDPLDIISSGPTVADSSTTEQCLSLIERFELSEKTPASILSFLKSNLTTKSGMKAVRHQPAGSSGKGSLEDVLNIVVGSNQIAVNSACTKAEEMGYFSLVMTSAQEGNAADVGAMFAKLARFICLLIHNKKGYSRQLSETELKLVGLGMSKGRLNAISKDVRTANRLEKGVCIIAGGETTVNIRGNGKGGRNQEMALACALAMKEEILKCDTISNFRVQFLSGGTDGIDGPTDAAGAVVSPNFCASALKEGLDPVKYLDNNDSYSIFSQFSDGSNLIKTGHTGTNVMDLQILLVTPN